jgi:hypothetical protein
MKPERAGERPGREGALKRGSPLSSGPSAGAPSDVTEPDAELSDPASPEDDAPLEEINTLYRRALDLVRNEFELRNFEMFWLTVIDNRPSAAMGVAAGAVRQARSRILHRPREEVGDLL